jgi:CubicO group peptidase (beta-lactamase class C family)
MVIVLAHQVVEGVPPHTEPRCGAARDFAKLGELYRNGGIWEGRRIVSEEWVRRSTSVNSPVREPSRPIVGDQPVDLGYGYQWWLPAGTRGEFCAMGVLNQLVHVDPGTSTTIVKLSANRNFGTSNDEATNRNMENIEFLRAIAMHVNRTEADA